MVYEKSYYHIQGSLQVIQHIVRIVVQTLEEQTLEEQTLEEQTLKEFFSIARRRHAGWLMIVL